MTPNSSPFDLHFSGELCKLSFWRVLIVIQPAKLDNLKPMGFLQLKK
jgi:hypothetical protein